MATKRRGRTKRLPWTKQDVRELREHSRSKSPVKEIARTMKRTLGALREKIEHFGVVQVQQRVAFETGEKGEGRCAGGFFKGKIVVA